jgi:hypothetical protein
MIGDIGSGQEDPKQLLDLAQAQAHGEGGGGQLLLLVLVQEDMGCGHRWLRGDQLQQPLVLGLESDHRFGGGRGGEAFFDLVGVLVDGLAAASGLLGLPGDGAVLTGEDGGSVEDPSANR